MKDIILELRHCTEVMDVEIVAGSDSRAKKRFVFHVLGNEWRVYHNGVVIDAGQAVEELLEVYNTL